MTQEQKKKLLLWVEELKANRNVAGTDIYFCDDVLNQLENIFPGITEETATVDEGEEAGGL